MKSDQETRTYELPESESLKLQNVVLQQRLAQLEIDRLRLEYDLIIFRICARLGVEAGPNVLVENNHTQLVVLGEKAEENEDDTGYDDGD